MRVWIRASIAAVVGAAALAPAVGQWMQPYDVPVTRLVANLERLVEERPQDADVHYVLGRVHGLAFVMQSRTVGVYLDLGGDLPDVASDSFQYGFVRSGPGTPPPPEAHEQLAHLDAAVEHLEIAIDLDETAALPPLGLAYVLERGRLHAERVECLPGDPPQPTEETRAAIVGLIERIAQGSADREALQSLSPSAIVAIHAAREHESDDVRDAVRAALERWWEQCAIDAYLAAFDLSVTEDLQITQPPSRGLHCLASYEAGRGVLRLIESRGGPTDGEREVVERVSAALAELDAKPGDVFVTPIIFALDDAKPLGELVDDERSVIFDLDGDGSAERWPWVRPDTAILVWDPSGRGKITSGRQLFGSVTWWMMFANGYDALAALDDDGDGWLRRTELQGIGLWCDRNGDGVSDPGEVTPIGAAGVVALAAQDTTVIDDVPAHPRGVVFDDGRALPTYDWIVAPCPDDEHGS